MVEVIALAGALPHASKHRQTAMFLGDIVNELHHGNGLADAGAAEQSHFAAFGKRAYQVDYLDAGLEQILTGREFLVDRGPAVDRGRLFRPYRAHFVDRTAEHVHDASQRLGAHRHRNRRAGIHHFHPAAQTVGGT